MSKMKVVAIIQARMGSQRLPGKSMMEIAGRPLLSYVIERVKKAESLDSLILATSINPENDLLCRLAEKLNVEVFRGSELDVLSRFVEAGKGANADIIVRVCADNPLIDPGEIDRIVKHHIHTGADYSFNHIPTKENNYPDGLGAEVIDAKILYSLSELALTPEEKEHVTLHITRNPDKYSIGSCNAPFEILGPDIKLDIDTLDDFTRMKKFIESLNDGGNPFWSAADIVRNYRIFFNSNVIILLNSREEAEYYINNYYNNSSGIISIVTSPYAWWEFEKRNISTERIDKFFNPEEMYKIGMENYDTLEKICSVYDEEILKNDRLMKKYKLMITRYNFFELKKIFDSLTINIRLLSKIITIMKPTLIVSFSQTSTKKFERTMLFGKERSLINYYSIILRLEGWNCKTAIFYLPDKSQDSKNKHNYLEKIRELILQMPGFIVNLLFSKIRAIYKGIAFFFCSCWNYISGKKSLLLLSDGYDWEKIVDKLKEHNYIFDHIRDNCNTKQNNQYNLELLCSKAPININQFCIQDSINFTEVFTSAIHSRLNEQIPNIPCIVNFAENKIIKKNTIAVVCAAKTRVQEFIIARVAQFHRIPVISWQHGAYGYFLAPMILYAEFMTNDIQLSYGAGVSKTMMEDPLNSFCESTPIGSFELQEMHRKTQLNLGKNRILYVSTAYYKSGHIITYPLPYHDNTYWEIQKKILNFMGRCNRNVICKLHPSESSETNVDEYLSLHSFKNIQIYKNTSSFRNLLDEVDIVIIDFPSTVLLQAIASHKTIFVLNKFIILNTDAIILLKKRVFYATTFEEFKNLIEKYLSDKPMDQHPDINNHEFLEQYGIFSIEGSVEERVISVLNKITGIPIEKRR